MLKKLKRSDLILKLELFQKDDIDELYLNNWAERIVLDDEIEYQDDLVEGIISELSMSPVYLREHITKNVIGRFLFILKNIFDSNETNIAVSLSYDSNRVKLIEVMKRYKFKIINFPDLEEYILTHFKIELTDFPFLEIFSDDFCKDSSYDICIKRLLFKEDRSNVGTADDLE